MREHGGAGYWDSKHGLWNFLGLESSLYGALHRD